MDSAEVSIGIDAEPNTVGNQQQEEQQEPQNNPQEDQQEDLKTDAEVKSDQQKQQKEESEEFDGIFDSFSSTIQYQYQTKDDNQKQDDDALEINTNPLEPDIKDQKQEVESREDKMTTGPNSDLHQVFEDKADFDASHIPFQLHEQGAKQKHHRIDIIGENQVEFTNPYLSYQQQDPIQQREDAPSSSKQPDQHSQQLQQEMKYQYINYGLDSDTEPSPSVDFNKKKPATEGVDEIRPSTSTKHKKQKRRKRDIEVEDFDRRSSTSSSSRKKQRDRRQRQVDFNNDGEFDSIPSLSRKEEEGRKKKKSCFDLLEFDDMYVKKYWDGRLKVMECITTFIAAVSLPEGIDDYYKSRFIFFRVVSVVAFAFIALDLFLHLCSLWNTLPRSITNPKIFVVLSGLATIGFLISSGLVVVLADITTDEQRTLIACFFGFISMLLFGVEMVLHCMKVKSLAAYQQ